MRFGPNLGMFPVQAAALFADSAPEMESAELKAELMDDLKSDFKSESPEL
jgi:hypothetical protein